MATTEQVKILEAIQKERAKARKKHLNVAEELSGGQKKYKTAINTMISVGALSIVVAVLTFTISAYNYVSFFSYGRRLDDQGWIMLVLQCAALITTLTLGLKLYKVDATPMFALVSLIIILVSNLLLFNGILPWITAALSIVGIVCWGTYKNWFYDIVVSGNKKSRGKR